MKHNLLNDNSSEGQPVSNFKSQEEVETDYEAVAIVPARNTFRQCVRGCANGARAGVCQRVQGGEGLVHRLGHKAPEVKLKGEEQSDRDHDPPALCESHGE
eukprot:6186818-Pleurochrysis_carterae.AAC.2